MASVFIRIRRKIRDGNFLAKRHALDELEGDGFAELDAVAAILNAAEFDKLTDDESHVRYVFYGHARDDRPLAVVVTIHQGTVILKTAYEDIS